MLLSSHNARGNLVLSSLSQADFARMELFLSSVQFRTRECIELINRKIENVIFPYRGLLSVIAYSKGKRHEAEAGVIGWEGMTGASVVLGVERPATTTIVQMDGDGRVISADNLRMLMEESPSLRETLLKGAYAFLAQSASTTLANARGKLDQRLGRWLLMAHDRCLGKDLHLTHEFLGLMLGVRRAGVTIALQTLEAEGLIAYSRGQIAIRDRDGLEEFCNGFYGMPEHELAHLTT
jgi:CRP-like cAMP-binding protein